MPSGSENDKFINLEEEGSVTSAPGASTDINLEEEGETVATTSVDTAGNKESLE